VLTGGGDAPGLNAVIRAVVKGSSQLGWEVVGFERGFEGLLPTGKMRFLTSENTAGILNLGGTILGTVNRGSFAVKVGMGESRDLDPEIVRAVKQTCRDLNLKGLVCIGGDGSLTIAQRLFEQGVPVVGVPKTIDNDLDATVITFGFDTAVSCATDALDRLHTSAASHERVMVVEVMGRHAGWIATHAGIAGGADIILIPEIGWGFDPLVAKIRQREKIGRPFAMAVVAEGARWPDGGQITQGAGGGQLRETRLGGIGERVSAELEKRSGRESRHLLLGHLQRGGAPTTFDRLLATRFGVAAVQLIQEGKFGQMVSLAPPNITSVSIAEAVGRIRTVGPDSDIVRTARGLGITFGDQ
jgi:6-phosphofructokinase 1